MTAGTGLEGDAKRLAGFGQPLAPVAEIAQGGPLEAAAGKLMQHWDNALAVMPVRRRDMDRQREAVLVHGEMDLDALDLLAAVEAAREASRRRLTRSLTRQLSACGQRKKLWGERRDLRHLCCADTDGEAQCPSPMTCPSLWSLSTMTARWCA